ncbi:endogenous retrovirus group K member 9 Gag polyprotein-like [Peromyscus californicus insignis]|uniref:endogenous retrovirus group K member 9 Gag polyprotein-like n=1 Tax=Peromyscus californicus insignis TaxID=564181 RepID=UPI0022A74D3B|nr:endogenous retrovirus group K member 9 Gag polyprotein-like [Peromyscus californicus insignis]
MGQGSSSHDLFLKGIKEALKTRGIRVRKKDLNKFFSHLEDCCPWFPQEGTIDEKRWKRVGDCLIDYYRVFGPDKVPVVIFSYWNLVNDILKIQRTFPSPDIESVISQGQKVMKEQSRPPSRADSHPPRPPSRAPSIQEIKNMEEGAQSPPPQSIYSSLQELDPAPLNPGDEASQKKEAAKYNFDWPPHVSLAPLTPLSQKPLPTKTPYNLTQPPPYDTPPIAPFCAPVIEAPAGSPLALPMLTPDDSEIPPNLVTELQRLQGTLRARRQHLALLKELRSLDQELSDLALGAPKTRPSPTFPSLKKPRPQPVLAFPVTRSQTSGSDLPILPEMEELPPLEEEGETLHEEGPPVTGSGDDQGPPPGQSYQKLSFRFVERLKSACAQYGPTAPFTLALLENQSEAWLTPNDWYFLARAALSGGDFVLWKTDFSENCRETAQRNADDPSSKHWTINKLLGKTPYDKNEVQATFPPGLLAQIQVAGLRAWKRLPQKGAATTSLAKVRQGPDEPYSDFISRLNDAAERLLGSGESESTFVKHLAFENANPACQEILRPHRDRAPLSEYIRLCAGVGSAHTIGLAIGAALKSAGAQDLRSQQSRLCFSCKQPGHFARECPKRIPAPLGGTATMPQPGVTTRPLPTTLCPRCGRGLHWARECRSKTNAHGHPLPPRPSGNFLRGQPLAPPLRGVPHGASQAAPQLSAPSNGQPQVAQAWTSVPPPTQY